MKKPALFVALSALAIPAMLVAIPQQIGGVGFNNIMEEDKWDRPPNYEEWRMDGLGKDGRLPAAGDPKPNVWVNTKPVDVLGLQAPVGAARLRAEDGKWESIAVKLPARKSDDFHLLKRTLEAETGQKITVTGKAGERALTASVSRLKMDIRESASGGLDVAISRVPDATVSSR